MGAGGDDALALGAAAPTALAEGVAVASALGEGVGLAAGVPATEGAAVVGAAVAVGAGVAGGAVRGAGVGGAVVGGGGGGVGGGGGGGVGAGVAGPTTVTLPRIEGCTAQWYANVPATVNVNEKLWPFASTLLSHVPLSAVEVWKIALPSLFVQRTVSPTLIVIPAGANAKPAMETAEVAASTASGAARRRSESAPAAVHATTPAGLTRIRYGPCRSQRSVARPSASGCGSRSRSSRTASVSPVCSSNAIRR